MGAEEEELAEDNEVAEGNAAEEEFAESNEAATGLWTVSPFGVNFVEHTEGTTTTVTFAASDLTPVYAEANEPLGRVAGWHLGVKFNEPTDMTDENRASVKYSFDNKPASGEYK